MPAFWPLSCTGKDVSEKVLSECPPGFAWTFLCQEVIPTGSPAADANTETLQALRDQGEGWR